MSTPQTCAEGMRKKHEDLLFELVHCFEWRRSAAEATPVLTNGRIIAAASTQRHKLPLSTWRLVAQQVIRFSIEQELAGISHCTDRQTDDPSCFSMTIYFCVR